jgi:hypothetical protein
MSLIESKPPTIGTIHKKRKRYHNRHQQKEEKSFYGHSS